MLSLGGVMFSGFLPLAGLCAKGRQMQHDLLQGG